MQTAKPQYRFLISSYDSPLINRGARVLETAQDCQTPVRVSPELDSSPLQSAAHLPIWPPAYCLLIFSCPSR